MKTSWCINKVLQTHGQTDNQSDNVGTQSPIKPQTKVSQTEKLLFRSNISINIGIKKGKKLN